MKIVERGKLFGCLNVFDVIILVLILGALVGLFAKTAALKKMMKDYTVSHVRTVLLVNNVYPEQAEAVKPGAVVSELRSGETIGVVKDVEVRDYMERAADAQGNWHWSPVPGKKDVIITLEGDLKSYNGFLRVGQVNVAAGCKINITSPGFGFEAQVLKVDVLR
ncbi:MAG: DUF4330 domain-containing protein [Thermacetogeniaceae bacterium]